MSEKRRGLGRGLGALIPSSAAANGSGNATAVSRPVDLFFPEGRKKTDSVAESSEARQPTGTAANKRPSSPAAKPATDQRAAGSADASKGTSSEPHTPSKPAPGDDTEKDIPAQLAEAAQVEESRADVADPIDPGTSAEPVNIPSAGSNAGVELVEVPGVHYAEISVANIHPNRKQPRSVFDEDDMAELVHSVREIGVLQPIVVRRSTEEGSEPFELVMGERRWRAVQAAGLDTIPAIVRDTTDDDLLRDALLENLHRSQLNPLEEAAAYQQLLEDFGTTHEQLADRIGRSRPQVSNTLRLLKLPPLVQRRVAAGVLSAGHARALLALPDAAAMERLAQRIVAEGMSVRATEEAVALYQDPAKPAKNNIPRPGARHERLDYLASSLSDRLDTNVKISLGVRKGKVSIEFASVEDLNRIMEVLAPGADS
ncbi:ParB/RepB/Spo0J family partition protein [Pseudarthrobacter sp. NamE5]|uniref:ParB/RepB/Spo0J family partition protein n=1 Tax=Pseudarthrobacter sp. NamE5 TaxID=2576839 RepID=UPI00110B1049|nr:ParB/RepB/Spo0J family partition protein [Pseudarthrobacter sp. NamE5]TLM82556.1 ParB/RepB/Spo0J family partition protein [Pseudarthrobacter sp. NamE5]